ncbi:hypothetical protein Syun_016451 [Stephania yunnanensis]|uniref:Uncharacterized protein n=1 Tax=Stephania yunnanensis TaxID=152371 RepID=A0AAP0J580_9MAGN
MKGKSVLVLLYHILHQLVAVLAINTTHQNHGFHHPSFPHHCTTPSLMVITDH